MEIQEGKEVVHESIVLDKHNGRQIYHTDDHCGRKAVTELIDSNYVRNSLNEEGDTTT